MAPSFLIVEPSRLEVCMVVSVCLSLSPLPLSLPLSCQTLKPCPFRFILTSLVVSYSVWLLAFQSGLFCLCCSSFPGSGCSGRQLPKGTASFPLWHLEIRGYHLIVLQIYCWLVIMKFYITNWGHSSNDQWYLWCCSLRSRKSNIPSKRITAFM